MTDNPPEQAPGTEPSPADIAALLNSPVESPDAELPLEMAEPQADIDLEEQEPLPDPWVRDQQPFGKVVVTPTEQALYLKATLNDTPLELAIPMPGDSTVTVRSVTAFEREACEQAMVLDQQDNKEFSSVSLATRYQGYLVCLQVTYVNDTALPKVKLDVDTMTLVEAAQHVREAYLKHWQKMQPPRYNLLLSAVRLFMVKQQMCDDALQNESFWSSADIS